MSRQPFTEGELRFIEGRAARGVDTPAMTARFLIADLRAAREELAEAQTRLDAVVKLCLGANRSNPWVKLVHAAATGKP